MDSYQESDKNYFEISSTSIGSLNRYQLKQRIKNFRGRFELDFSDAYLDNLTVDKLRHILLAAIINSKKSLESKID